MQHSLDDAQVPLPHVSKPQFPAGAQYPPFGTQVYDGGLVGIGAVVGVFVGQVVLQQNLPDAQVPLPQFGEHDSPFGKQLPLHVYA